MSLSTKILLSIVAIVLICVGGFIVFKQMETSKRLDDIQNSIVLQKQLLDNITRAQSQYASKEDIEDFAKQQNINLDVIKKDMDALNAQVKAINGITIISQSQNSNNIPSTNTTPRPDPTTIEPGSDPFGYMNNTQHLALNEKFSNVEVPFGTVSFSAFRDKPWDISIAERKYSVTSVLGQDESGKYYSYSKFAIQSSGKTYDVKIDDNKFLEEYPESKFRFGPKLFLMANGGINVSHSPPQGEFTPGVAVGIASYGRTKSNPSFSIAQVGIGYGVRNKSIEFSISPVQYNIGQHIPFTSANTYIGPTFQLNTKGEVTPGAGITIGF